MTENKLISVVGFINQTSIAFFWEKAKSLSIFNFPPGSVVDLEVRKFELLASSFREFLDQAKLAPSQIYLVIAAELVFESGFPAKDPDSAKEEIELFIKSVPFEHVASRVFLEGKGCKVCSINRELYETLQSVLESQENIVAAVAPATVLAQYLKSGFNANSARQLLRKADLIRQNSLIYQEEAKEEQLQKGSDPRKNKKLLTMLIVFGLMLVFLGIMVIRMMQENKVKPRPTQIPAPEAVAPTKATMAVVTQTATESGTNFKNLKVRILNATGTLGLAANAKEQLTSLGFDNIETSNSPTLNSTKQIVGFSSSVSNLTRQKLVIEFSKLFGDPSIQELSDSTFDIVITLTKSSDSSSSAQTAP